MEQLQIFYFIVTSLIGIVSFGLISFFYYSSKNIKIKTFLFFYIAFTLIIIFNFLTSYLKANIDNYENTIYYLLLYLENPVVFTTLIFLIPFFIHDLIEVPPRKKYNLFFLIAAVLTFIVHNAFVFLGNRITISQPISILKNSVFLVTVIYCWIILIRYSFFGKSEVNNFIQSFSVSWGVIFLAIVNDTFLLNRTGIKIFPIIYASVGLFFTFYYYKQVFSKPNNLSEVPDPEFLADDFEKRFNLSSREMEVIKLLVSGKSYKQISEDLFISLNTVKTHIRNIYPKLNISSRHEIVSLINQFRQTQNQSN